MRITAMIGVVSISGILLLSSLGLGSCTKKITEEQLQQLQDLRRQEASLNNEITNANNEIRKIEDEIRARKRLVDDCNKDKDFIEQKLREWPNVWPDYTPAR
jgi:chromosome segregation ATPase